jgi:hypothetical protein
MRPSSIFVILIGLCVSTSAFALRQETDTASRGAGASDGLQLVPSGDFAVAYFRSDSDFSGYDKIILEEPKVAFREGWRRQHRDATINDMEQIRRERAEWFLDVFIRALRDEEGYQVVDEAGEEVLLIRAGIGDLDILVPAFTTDTRSDYLLSGSLNEHAESGTTATLVLELVDSVSGEVLARVFDRQHATSADFSPAATRFSNERDARNIFTGWAESLRSLIGRGS